MTTNEPRTNPPATTNKTGRLPRRPWPILVGVVNAPYQPRTAAGREGRQ